jgi:predicted nucleotidyltransferase
MTTTLQRFTAVESAQLPYGLARWLIGGSPLVYIFGGFLRSIINPDLDFTDIDLLVRSPDALDQMTDKFGIVFRKVSRFGATPEYFIGKSRLAGTKPLHVVLMRSHEEIVRFVTNSQYDIDRVALSNNRLYCDPAIGEDAILHALDAKRASRVRTPRDMSLFAINRAQIEIKHRNKLIQKGYTIID